MEELDGRPIPSFRMCSQNQFSLFTPCYSPCVIIYRLSMHKCNLIENEECKDNDPVSDEKSIVENCTPPLLLEWQCNLDNALGFSESQFDGCRYLTTFLIANHNRVNIRL